MSFAPGLLSKLFGGDPQKKYRQQVQQLTSPQNIGKLTNQFYQQGLASPAFSQAQGQIAAGANQTSNQVNANLGARGIGTSGTAAILSALTPSLVGSQQAGLRTATQGAAQGMAQNSIMAQLQALQALQGQPSQTQGLFGAGLEAFGPILQAWFKSQGKKIPAGTPATAQAGYPAGAGFGGFSGGPDLSFLFGNKP